MNLFQRNCLTFLLLVISCKADSPKANLEAIIQLPITTTNTLRIFLTNSAYTGNLGGISGADAKCTADTSNPGTATFKAFLSAQGGNRRACSATNCAGGSPIDWVLQPNKTYVRATDSLTIFTTNENGIFVFDPSILTNSFTGSADSYWTGKNTVNFWTPSMYNCSNWTSDNSGEEGRPGTGNVTDYSSIGSPQVGCHNTKHLLCVEQ